MPFLSITERRLPAGAETSISTPVTIPDKAKFLLSHQNTLPQLSPTTYSTGRHRLWPIYTQLTEEAEPKPTTLSEAVFHIPNLPTEAVIAPI
ncbi:hypothetical protein BaRGS_00004072 [Batillaria attramentaria]|uniref:Uncharacterized protein n=1 Tax=Batillaria attramentaria TaxID=370345 RepID=A0ABD0LZJ8_9CAEN